MAADYEYSQPRATRLGLKHAITPVVGVLCFLAGLATTMIEPTPTLAVDEVVVMKPIEGSDGAPVFPKMPIELLYGVPSERTEHLWSPHKKQKLDADKASDAAAPSES
jgi:hypothetical protein